jgi:YD repeat-containing protein
MIVSGVKGLLGSFGVVLPGAEGAAGGGLASLEMGAAGDGAAGSAAGSLAGALADAQTGGAALGDAVGVAAAADAAVPSGLLGELLGDMGPLGSQGTTLPDVGGILFEHCDAELSDVGELTGAYWDAQTNSLVLVGRTGPEGQAAVMGLPAMDQDNLAVALRAALAGDPIGVSIDPPAEYREGIRRGVAPPEGTFMLVSYLGGIEGTLFGAILFEADRLLKCLDKGVHNETRRPVRATVPGFKPLLEMIQPGDGGSCSAWHRFWFVIDTVELRHDPGSDALTFGDVRLKVLTETEVEGPPAQVVNPCDEAFTRHLTEHYDDYAKDFPILMRLKELAKISAVAKFLANRQMPLDLDALFSQPPQPVKTPASTPGIKVTSPNVKVRHMGNITQTRTVSLFGGVDMKKPPRVVPDATGLARRLKELAQATRPGPGAAAWTFSQEGRLLHALALKVGIRQTPFRWKCDDHVFATGGPLCIRRVYDATKPNRDFGPGWTLWVPLSITVRLAGGKRREVRTTRDGSDRGPSRVLILHDHVTGQSHLYHFIEADPQGRPAAFCRVASQTTDDDGTSFSYDPADRILLDGDGYAVERDGRRYRFDSAGRLTAIVRGGEKLACYEWRDGRVARTSDGAGHSYEVCRPKGGGPIRKIVASDGHTMFYTYDRQGLLAQGGAEREAAETYAYDAYGRLAEVRNRAGKVVARGLHDDLHEHLTEGQDVVTTPAGLRIWRRAAEGRLVSAKDEAGTVAEYHYGPDSGHLATVDIRHPSKRGWSLEYDPRGRISSLRTPLGGHVRLFYDDQGNVQGRQDERGRSVAYERDEHGRLVGGKDALGHTWSATYDPRGRLSQVAVGGQLWQCRVGEGRMELIGPGGTAVATSARDRAAWRAVAPDGTWRECVCRRLSQPFSERLQLARVCAKGVRATRLDYDSRASLCGVRSAPGRLHYDVDEQALTVSVTFV